MLRSSTTRRARHSSRPPRWKRPSVRLSNRRRHQCRQDRWQAVAGAAAAGIKQVVFDHGAYITMGASRRSPRAPVVVSTSSSSGRARNVRAASLPDIRRRDCMHAVVTGKTDRREGEGGRGRDRHNNEERDSEFVDRLVHINRVAKGREGWSSLRLRRSRRRRRPEGSRWLRSWQGA